MAGTYSENTGLIKAADRRLSQSRRSLSFSPPRGEKVGDVRALPHPEPDGETD